MTRKRKANGKKFLEVVAEKYQGKSAAILCARYWYRGIVAEVGQNYILLTEVQAEEVTRPAATLLRQTEDPVPTDMLISADAIEQICQPAWVWKEKSKRKE